MDLTYKKLFSLILSEIIEYTILFAKDNDPKLTIVSL